MPIAFTIDDLLAYSDWERTKWLEFFRANGPDTLAVGLGPNAAGRITNIGQLVRHIFTAEQRYTERARQVPLTDNMIVADNDIEALFAFGAKSRASMRALLATFPDSEWNAPREMQFGPNDTRPSNSRKFVLQAVTHELRHWAHVAAFLRQAGYKPGMHDLIASPLF